MNRLFVAILIGVALAFLIFMYVHDYRECMASGQHDSFFCETYAMRGL